MLRVRATGQGGGGYEGKKKVCVPKVGLSFLALFKILLFPRGIVFGFGWGAGSARQIPPPPPVWICTSLAFPSLRHAGATRVPRVAPNRCTPALWPLPVCADACRTDGDGQCLGPCSRDDFPPSRPHPLTPTTTKWTMPFAVVREGMRERWGISMCFAAARCRGRRATGTSSLHVAGVGIVVTTVQKGVIPIVVISQTGES